MAGVERAAIDPRCKTGGCYRPEPVRHVIGEAPVLGRGWPCEHRRLDIQVNRGSVSRRASRARTTARRPCSLPSALPMFEICSEANGSQIGTLPQPRSRRSCRLKRCSREPLPIFWIVCGPRRKARVRCWTTSLPPTIACFNSWTAWNCRT